jgi:plasmid stabilization system protein ParE
MVKRLVWTEKALLTRKEILDYWKNATGNNHYSLKLDLEFEKLTNLLVLYPELGKEIKNYPARSIVYRDYTIIYKVDSDDSNLEIKILQVWDTRRDPDNLKF